MEENQSSYDGESDQAHDNPHDFDQDDPNNPHLQANLSSPSSSSTLNKQLLGGKKNYYLDPSTFLTSVNQVEKGPKKLNEVYVPNASEINSCHSQLNNLVNDLGLRITDVIKGHENDFFIAFKNKMYAIMKEMRELKEKASSERHKAKQEARLVNLEKERDWFRREALKLDKICKDHKRILNKLKATLENIEEDRDFFQEQLFNAKKVNKALLMEVEKYKKALNSGSQGLDQNSQLQVGYSQPLAITNEERPKHSASKIKSKVDQALARNSGLKEGDYDLDKDEDDDFDDNDFEDLKSKDETYKPDYKAITGQSTQNKFYSSLKKPTTQELATLDNQPSAFAQEDYVKLQREVHELKDKESKYIDTIKHLKNQIDNEKKHARVLRADKVNFMTQRNELEEFFLQCIEEVRKEIVKRKTISSYSSKRGMKKSTSQASMQKQQDFDNIPGPKLDHFTATDKRKVIELLMSNENVLLFLYEKLFPVSNISQQSTQSRGNTAPYSQNNPGSGLPSQNMQFRFMTDSGIPIQTQNRSQTAVAGSRLNFKAGQDYGGNSQQLPFNLNQEIGTTVSGALQNVLPHQSAQGMSIQNNIQNINLNINMAKGGYGSQPYIPQKIVRGSTAPLGQQRSKKSYQTQLNAVVGNKYQL